MKGRKERFGKLVHASELPLPAEMRCLQPLAASCRPKLEAPKTVEQAEDTSKSC